MTTKSDAVLFTITGVCRTYNKGYCYPTQKHILYLVRKYHKIEMSRRTLNRILKKLESDGWIERIRRHTKKNDGSLWLRSTLYKLLGKVREWAIRKMHWACGILGISAVPKVSQHYSSRERMISKRIPPDVHILWKTFEKGRASPS
jgi:hypothetical protein